MTKPTFDELFKLTPIQEASPSGALGWNNEIYQIGEIYWKVSYFPFASTQEEYTKSISIIQVKPVQVTQYEEVK